MLTKKLRTYLESLYATFNRREFVEPDPLQFLYNYPGAADREVVALVCATLAYGRVAHILRSLETVLARLGPRPADFIMQATTRELMLALSGIRHRFTSGEELAQLLCGARKITKQYGSLGCCLRSKLAQQETTILPALESWTQELRAASGGLDLYTLPSPARGSACKRLNLLLRWMVRCDDVDPGGWEGISPSLLVIPLDTHMDTIGRSLGFTCRKQADLKTTLEITAGFRKIAPQDPVRYDFSLTRFGIRSDLEIRHVTGPFKDLYKNHGP